jgi:hypothetical protein
VLLLVVAELVREHLLRVNMEELRSEIFERAAWSAATDS